ncbi:MAG: hypothetical protein ACKVQJ_01130 [Pyrinomonadaceae bacterium]
MKKNLQTAFLLSVFTVVFGLAVSAQPYGSGVYKAVDKPNEDAGVGLAADFAVKEQSAKSKKDIKLAEILKAADGSAKLGARNLQLCLNVTTGTKSSTVQAIVTMDQYSNLKLHGWATSTCGKSDSGSGKGSGTGTRTGSGFKPDSDYKAGAINDVGADLAAQNAIIQQEAKTKAQITFGEMIKVEYKETKLDAADFRLCMSVVNNGKPGRAQALVSKDQYQNFKLTSWTDGKCGESADGFTKVEQFTAGVDLAADFAVKKHSEDTGIEHKIVEILKREEKGDEKNLMAATYRICMKVGEDGKTEVIQAVVSKDGYSNHKLVSWVHSKCTK